MPRSGAHRSSSTKAVLALVISSFVIVILMFGMGRYGWITMLRVDRQQKRIKKEMLANLAHLESQAREKLGMTRPGETSYRFYPADSLKKRP